MREKKDKTNLVEKPKSNSVSVKCPYCDKSAIQKIRYSLVESTPNLIDCPDCHYHFIVIQKTDIKLLVIELQDQIEESVGTGALPRRVLEGAEIEK